tara:strand:- start:3740 stop:4099 length:360 start_codon:yes stop_codon:yes gene_type:complete
MTHYAKIESGIVTNVLVAERDFIDNHMTGTWVQTSYNTRGGKHFAPNSNTEDDGVALNKNYAGIGHIYVEGVGFHEPQPYTSWTLDEDTYLWEPPSAYPGDGKRYTWDEDTEAWVEGGL